MEITGMIFLACPPVYTLPGTWNDPEKIARCTGQYPVVLWLSNNQVYGDVAERVMRDNDPVLGVWDAEAGTYREIGIK